MSSFAQTDIVNSATPLETRYLGVHPRLYATDEGIEAIRRKLGGQPWADFLQRVEFVAGQAIQRGVPSGSGDDLRGVGCGLAHLAIAYRLTDKPSYLAAARAQMAQMAARQDWTYSLQYGHWAHGMAVAYDWLYHAIDEPLRQAARQALSERTEAIYTRWVHFVNAYPNSYAWNHSAVVHGGIMAAGCALWGEIDGPGRWLRLALEKMQLMVGALGPDGASAEGLAYGQYHLEFLLKSMIFTEQLLGLDLFEECQFLRNYSRFMLYSALPRSAWVAGPPENRARALAFVHLSDTDGRHWNGPDTQLRLVARRYRDGYAQGLADESARAQINGDASSYFNLFYHDETVAPRKPDDLPTMHHFKDKDVVFLRSGWDEQASVLAIKCGPSAGYHAARHYRQNVSGGHMHPDAGHVVLHACGDWLLIDDGYTQKATSYQNTLLVNGIGQTGEGAAWFEDLEMRRGKPEGKILRAQSGAAIDDVIADAAPAYKPEARLRKFLRHLLYLKPDVWVLIDEVEAQADSTFELRFHALHAFTPVDAASWAMRGERGALRLWTLGPTASIAQPFQDEVKGMAMYRDRMVDALAIRNAAPQRSALFVTVLHAHPAGAAPRLSAALERQGAGFNLHLTGGERPLRLALEPGQADPAKPIFAVGQG